MGEGEGHSNVSYVVGLLQGSHVALYPLSAFRGVMSQSTRAHRLAQKAYQIGGQKLQMPILCSLFKANLEDGKDIADINVLADLAAAAGVMSKDEVCR